MNRRGNPQRERLQTCPHSQMRPGAVSEAIFAWKFTRKVESRGPWGRMMACMTGRERFLAALECRMVDRTPIWLMRQAGRCLPEYRALKEKHSFLQMVHTPELAAEVTLQPVRRFGFDAAILFSDILVVPQAMGQGFDFADAGGIKMASTLRDAADIDRLDAGAVTERLAYTAQALKLIKSELGGRTALLGFAGSPWTLANFMLEGGSAREFTVARTLFYSDQPLFSRLMAKLTRAVATFLQMQIDAGVDAVQIFDSVGGALPPDGFNAGSGRWMKEIIDALERQVPVIVFSKGTHGNWKSLAATGAHAVGVDWSVRLADAVSSLPSTTAIQGNLDPAVLLTTPEIVTNEARRILGEMAGRHGHIFNLGHGVPPTARLENLETLVSTVRETVVLDAAGRRAALSHPLGKGESPVRHSSPFGNHATAAGGLPFPPEARDTARVPAA